MTWLLFKILPLLCACDIARTSIVLRSLERILGMVAADEVHLQVQTAPAVKCRRGAKDTNAPTALCKMHRQWKYCSAKCIRRSHTAPLDASCTLPVHLLACAPSLSHLLIMKALELVTPFLIKIAKQCSTFTLRRLDICTDF